MSDIETKLTRARTKLIIDKPFLGALVLRLPLVEADPKWMQTTGTDARKLYYNPDYIDALSLDQVQFVLSHEALHCALSHFARRQHRNKYRWDVACDYAINPLLLADGLVPPPGMLYERTYDGMTAEEIYPFIDENNADEPMDQHLYDDSEQDSEGKPPPQSPPDRNQSDEPQDNTERDEDEPPNPDESDDSDSGDPDEQNGEGDQDGNDAETDENSGGAPQPPPLTPQEQDELEVQWQQRLAGAAQQAMQAGKLGGAIKRMIDHLLQPQLPWRMLLARYMTAVARDDYSYSRPSRRDGEFIMPSLRSAQINVVVAIDTSGSVTDKELERFASEVNAIKGQMRARITLLACDAELSANGPWSFEPWEEFKLPASLDGGGGTDYNPVFQWVTQSDLNPDLLVYFTDAKGSFPKVEPPLETVWLVKGKSPVPFGQRIQLNE